MDKTLKWDKHNLSIPLCFRNIIVSFLLKLYQEKKFQHSDNKFIDNHLIFPNRNISKEYINIMNFFLFLLLENMIFVSIIGARYQCCMITRGKRINFTKIKCDEFIYEQSKTKYNKASKWHNQDLIRCRKE